MSEMDQGLLTLLELTLVSGRMLLQLAPFYCLLPLVSSPVSHNTGTLKTAQGRSERGFGTRLHATTFATNKYTAPISMIRTEHGQVG